MNSSTFNQTSNSRSGERVAAWKSDVRAFFDEDWSRLRTLMMDLEEAAWNDESVDPESHARMVCDSNAAAIPASPKPNRRRSVEPAAPRDRLAELAEQLERRLRTSNRGR